MKPDRSGPDADALERLAARALREVPDGSLIGLGSGHTAAAFVRALGRRVREGLRVRGVPTSEATGRLAHEVGVPLATLDEGVLEVTIDGADEVDPQFNLIKGGGGALFHEKVVAQATDREIIVVDDSKLSNYLGTLHVLPVEVSPFGWRSQLRYLESLGARPVRRKNSDGSQYVTDSGNLILDCDFGPIADPVDLAAKLGARAGIIEHGLFIGITSDLIVAGTNGVRHLKPK